MRQIDCFGKGATVGHQRRGSDDAALVRFRDGAVYTSGEPEVVGINDEAAQEQTVNGKVRTVKWAGLPRHAQGNC